MVDWGSVPAWVASVLTGSSFIIASLGYRKSVDEAEKDQARQVSAWIGTQERRDDPGGERVPHLLVRNSSDAAVSLVVLSYGRHATVAGERSFTTFAMIGPQTTDGLPVPPTANVASPGTLTFLDSNGRLWRRQKSGKLVCPKKREQDRAVQALLRYF
jgi:hypothetical protein